MPLNIQHIRYGEPLRYRWGGWHLGAMINAVITDGGSVLRMPHTIQQERTITDPADGEVITLLPGDVIDMWR